jgi:hypothetical protein
VQRSVSPKPEEIFDAEKRDTEHFKCVKPRAVRHIDFRNAFKDHGCDIEKHHRYDQQTKMAAQAIAALSLSKNLQKSQL